MNKINIAITGYYGSGSSAVIDLLKEYSVVGYYPNDRKTYEHVPLYIGGGLFDMYNCLTHGNNPICSDATINRFVDTMRRIDSNDFKWFGGYKRMFGDEFESIYKSFVQSISEPFAGRNINHHICCKLSCRQIVIHSLSSIKHLRIHQNFGKQIEYDNKPAYISLPTIEELEQTIRKFISDYLNMFASRTDKSYSLFDHLILPQQIDEYSNCFDDSVFFIVVYRDPRDAYILNKYIWSKRFGRTYYPTTVEAFIKIWKRMFVAQYTNPKAILFKFEDLVYNYENSVKIIEDKFQIDSSSHNKAKAFFNPDLSIENTQVFSIMEEWKDEVKAIENELGDFLYEFPYKRVPQQKLIFEP